MDINTLSDAELRKLAASLAKRRNRTDEDQCLLNTLRSRISENLGLEVSSGYEHWLSRFTWTKEPKGEIRTNLTVNGKRKTATLAQAVWAQMHGLKFEIVVGEKIKVNRTQDVEHHADFRTEVLTDSGTNYENALNRVERTDIPQEFWGLRYNRYGQWDFKVTMSSAQQKRYFSKVRYSCPRKALAGLRACIAAKARYYEIQPRTAPLPWKDLEAAERTVANNIEIGRRTQAPVELPEIPDSIINQLVQAAQDSKSKADDRIKRSFDRNHDADFLPKGMMTDIGPAPRSTSEYPPQMFSDHEFGVMAAELGMSADDLSNLFKEGKQNQLYRINRLK